MLTFSPPSCLFCSTYVTPVDETRIPTGEFLAITDTPFDFREPHRIGARIGEVPGPPPVGYDVNYVLWGRDEAGALKDTKGCVALPE
jgi:aldose 1-epimerase